MAEIERTPFKRAVTVRQNAAPFLKVYDVLVFAAALEAAGAPQDARLNVEDAHDTKHHVALRVHWEEEPDGRG